MYTANDRDILLNHIVKYMSSTPDFAILLQIGSGAVGYTDIYSDIDLMAGCFLGRSMEGVHDDLILFLRTLDPVYIDQRRWSKTVLGLSVYFDNGLSADISYMPADELQLRSPCWKVLFSKDMQFPEKLKSRNYISPISINDSIHHRFIYALRRCEIALCRSEYVYADMMLSEARQYLLTVEAAREGKKLHQFKMYNTLNDDFLKKLDYTYPTRRDCHWLIEAKKNMLKLYLEIVKDCDCLAFDDVQLKLLNQFE